MIHKKIKGLVSAVICILCCLAMLNVTAFTSLAASVEERNLGVLIDENVDITKKGSITVKEKYGEGISYYLYQVGEFDSTGHAYYTESFFEYKDEITVALPLAENSEDAEALVHNLYNIVVTNKIAPVASAKTDSSGSVTFNDLLPGFYFVIAESFTTDEGRVYSANPVFVSLPGSGEEGSYEITVESKSEQTDPTPVNPPKEDEPKKPTGNLPQTGVIWWPIAALAIAGIIFCILGFVTGRRKNS